MEKGREKREQQFILSSDGEGGEEEGLILHICTSQIRLPGVCQ